MVVTLDARGAGDQTWQWRIENERAREWKNAKASERISESANEKASERSVSRKNERESEQKSKRNSALLLSAHLIGDQRCWVLRRVWQLMIVSNSEWLTIESIETIEF